MRRVRDGLLFLLLAAALWIPCLRFAFPVDPASLPSAPGVSTFARALANRHLALWSDPASRARELDRMRGSNAEWDFMGRTYLVLAIVNMVLREPALATRALPVVDTILTETLALEERHGFYHFSMAYARGAPYRAQPPRSLFVDGEIALMLGARLVVGDDGRWRARFDERVMQVTERLTRGPTLCAESYPDECWTFDHATALAALRVADAVFGTDHSELCTRWVAMARRTLVEAKTGLLISEFHYDGTPLDGPEGSSLWMAAHALALVDPEFAREQYERARANLRVSIFGFDFAREWPAECPGTNDIDSGLVIPLLGASPASSGLAFLAASTFGDHEFHLGLLRSLEFAAFPQRTDGTLSYAASNQVGDAALLYSAVLGPLWDAVRKRSWR